MGPTFAAATRAAAGMRRRREDASKRAGKRVHLKWIKAFETGNDEIDALHRGLVRDCGSMLQLVENGAAWPLVIAGARKLVENCIRHFRREEALLEQTGFPRCAEHAAEHLHLGRDLRRVIDRMEQVDGSLDAHRDIARSLGPCLVDVIIRHDLDFRSHLLRHDGH